MPSASPFSAEGLSALRRRVLEMLWRARATGQDAYAVELERMLDAITAKQAGTK